MEEEIFNTSLSRSPHAAYGFSRHENVKSLHTIGTPKSKTSLQKNGMLELINC